VAIANNLRYLAWERSSFKREQGTNDRFGHAGHSLPANPSMSITSSIADSATCFFDPLPRCDFGFLFFFTFGRAASSRRA
jgi:hypothetical protein